jgi:hypothetical protein
MKNDPQMTLALGKQPMVDDDDDTVDMEAVVQEWKLAKNFVEMYSKDFKFLDQIADGAPLNHEDNATYVGDTTLAGLVRQIPRDSLEQLPVFSAIVNGTKHSTPAYLCTYMLKRFVFNEDTFGKGLLSTLQLAAQEALTHGYANLMCTTGTMYQDFGTTLKLMHYSDVAPEPGITDGNEMGYVYVTANLTKTRVQKIRDMAKDNPDTSWFVDALDELLLSQPLAKNYSIYQTDPQRNQAAEEAGPTYEFVTRYETGNDATIVTFSPQLPGKALRTMESKSKFGYPRVQLLVIDPAPLTPFGMSRVRLASPNQNLMNIYYGNIASMLLLNSKPPILKRGRFTKPVQLKQNAVWETLDQNATADLKTMDNGALKEFVPMAQQFVGQIQNIMGRTSGIANNNPAGFSKTGPGVKDQDRVQDSTTNQITKILENFLRQYALSALDTVICEQEGEQTLIVDDETMNAINNLASSQFVPQPDPNDPSGQTMTQFTPPIGDDHKILLNWEDFYLGKLTDPNDPNSQREGGIEEWSIDIEVSVSKDQMKDKQRQDLQDMMVVLAQNASELGPQTQQKVQEITDMLMQDLAPDVKPLTTPAGPPQPAQPPTPGAGQSAVGSQVHETGDLVKMFGMTSDPTLRNAILAAMNLPQVAKALPPVLVNPVDPMAKSTVSASGAVAPEAPTVQPTPPIPAGITPQQHQSIRQRVASRLTR